MPDPPPTASAAARDELFDKYTLPKVALVVILAAAFVGTWVTGRLGDQPGLGVTVVRWGYLVSLSVLTGGLVWHQLFVRPADLGADGYCEGMYDRFDRIAFGALVALTLAGGVVLGRYWAVLGADGLVLAYGLLVATWVGVTAAATLPERPVAARYRSPLGLASLGLALAVVVATALLEVGLGGFDPVAAAVRVVHLLAFAVWLGGAVWNIFVAVPTGQRRPTTAVVRAAGEQLERFRWAVRAIIPTLLVTGLYQAYDGLGTAVSTYLGAAVGLAVLAKLGLIGLLVAIFLLCPMWRACSPIDGVCDLEDLGGTPPEVAGDD